ncbi:unnamed protein product [Paramecium sonneborni]|uniref:Uncharacterized protein n=1 Tax=Paramecium sonneborni TaxID=65129 RepID=A0A8S1MNQ9_9CILI|nr:unnamed protein product [Paramecium sonneborni]
MTLTHQKIPKIKTIVEDYFFSECNKLHYSLSKNLYTNVAENFVINFYLFFGYDINYLDKFTQRWILCNSSLIFNLFYFQASSLKYAKIDAATYMQLQQILTLGRQQEELITDFQYLFLKFSFLNFTSSQSNSLQRTLFWLWITWIVKLTQNFHHMNKIIQLIQILIIQKIQQRVTLYLKMFISINKRRTYSHIQKSNYQLMQLQTYLQDIQNLSKLFNVFSKNIERLVLKLDQIIDYTQKQDLTKFVYINGFNLVYRISTQLNVTKLTLEDFRLLQLV